VQHADNDDRIRKRPIIDRVAIMERDAHASCKLFPLGTRERKISHRFKRRFESGNEAGRDLLGGFGCKISPDFRKVLFGRLRDTKS
jgi:hypothetical protein